MQLARNISSRHFQSSTLSDIFSYVCFVLTLMNVCKYIYHRYGVSKFLKLRKSELKPSLHRFRKAEEGDG